MKNTTELSLSSADKKFILAGGVIIGLIVGISLPFLWQLFEGFDVLPFHGALSFIMSFQYDWMTIVRPLALATIGLGLGALIITTTPRLIVSDEKIEIYKGSSRRIIKREQIAGMYLEKSKLIIESEQGRRLFAGDIEGGKQRITDAFTKRGYPWES